MATDFYVTLHGPRGRIFTDVLGTARLPVKSPIPQTAQLEGLGAEPVFFLQLDELSSDQVRRLARYFSEQSGVPADEIEAEIRQRGVPIRDVDCTVSIGNPQRWF